MKRLFPVVFLFSCLIAARSFAGSATWNLNPTSSDWNTAANWTPATIPNSPADVASFGTSTIKGLTLSSAITIASSVYEPSADGFTISSAGLTSLTFAGDGIVNSSATSQSFVVDIDETNAGGLISFTNSAIITGSVNFTVAGQNRSGNPKFATVEFHDNSSAGTPASFAKQVNTSPRRVGMYSSLILQARERVSSPARVHRVEMLLAGRLLSKVALPQAMESLP